MRAAQVHETSSAVSECASFHLSSGHECERASLLGLDTHNNLSVMELLRIRDIYINLLFHHQQILPEHCGCVYISMFYVNYGMLHKKMLDGNTKIHINPKNHA